MSLILESDIIYSILPHVGIPTMGVLFCVNKFVNKLCNDKYFWKEKVEKDYKNIILKSDDWIMEYKYIYETRIRANNCVDNFVFYIINRYHNRGSIIYIRPPIMTPVDLEYLRWIPSLSLLPPGYKANFSNFNIDTKKQVVHMELFGRHKKLTGKTAYLQLSYDEFKKYMANLYYYYNDDINMKYFNEWEVIYCRQK